MAIYSQLTSINIIFASYFQSCYLNILQAQQKWIVSRTLCCVEGIDALTVVVAAEALRSHHVKECARGGDATVPRHEKLHHFASIGIVIVIVTTTATYIATDGVYVVGCGIASVCVVVTESSCIAPGVAAHVVPVPAVFILTFSLTFTFTFTAHSKQLLQCLH